VPTRIVGQWHDGFALGPGAIDPATVANLRAWYKLDSEAYADNTILGVAGSTLVHDRSGNVLDLSQGNVGERPTFKTGIANGLPVIRCVTASFQSLTLPAVTMLPTASSPAEMFLVCRATSDPPAANRGPVNLGSSFAFPFTTGQIQDSFGDGGGSASSFSKVPNLATQFTVYNPSVEVTANGGQDFYLNGVLLLHVGAVASIGQWPGAGAFRLGQTGYGWFDGDIAEVIIYSRKLSTAERHGITLYLGAKYGITVV
jgi:hypothetical protein